MKYNSITIIDIAKALGISKSTVSRALKDSHDISADTRQRILDFAKQHHYEPNPVAKGLRQQQTFSIGVVVPEIRNNFFAQAIEGIDSIAVEKGYQTIVTQTYEQLQRERDSTLHLASRSIDGLIISVSAETSELDHLLRLHKKGLPIVFFDRVPEDFDTHKVVCDNRKGAFVATEWLIKAGYKRILHMANSRHLSITHERIAGYLDALRKYHIPEDPNLIYHCEHGAMNEIEVEKDMIRCFKRKPKPDAVFSSGDRITTLSYQIIRRLGLRIPEDLAFIGFSNNTMVELFHPSIMFIRQPAYEMGKAAASLLLQLVESKKPTRTFETRVMQPTMVDR